MQFKRKLNILGYKIFPQIVKYKFIIIGIIVVLAVLGIFKLINRKDTQTAMANDTRADVQLAKATMEINREFQFPLLDDRGKELTKIKYIIEKAELRDEIIVKGQRALAVKGKSFLIMSIKTTNTYDKSIQINTRDYVRLSVNGNKDELLAASIHNDPVSIQAISTQPARIGFTISDSDRDLKLLIGEIKGNKEEIVLDLK